MLGGVPQTDPAIQAFLGSATAIDDIDGPLTPTNDAPGTFPLGVTPVTFSATDEAGNTGMATSSLTVVDTTPPETSLLSALDGDGQAIAQDEITGSPDMTFTFSGADTVGVSSFECQLDAGPFAPCASSQSYMGLGLGDHLFQVRAVDASGNGDLSPAGLDVDHCCSPGH